MSNLKVPHICNHWLFKQTVLELWFLCCAPLIFKIRGAEHFVIHTVYLCQILLPTLPILLHGTDPQPDFSLFLIDLLPTSLTQELECQHFRQ